MTTSQAGASSIPNCAMTSSQGQQISQYEDVTLVQLTVQPPPATCPCIIRAVSIRAATPSPE
jgi:hypothetical protein